VGRPKRRLGQHFLFDPRILGRIADALGATRRDAVLEIGPGPGGLTAQLLTRTPHVVAIEKDADLLPRLRARFPALQLLEGDALDADWHAAIAPALASGGGEYLVTGNIPYNITTPLIDRALTSPFPARIVFLVQKEVAERTAAAPGGGEYGALSVGVQAACRVERLFTVAAGAFTPPPKIDSAVLRLTPRERPLVAAVDQPAFRRFVVGIFGFRRKQLLRAMREHTGWPAERVQAVLDRVGLQPTLRPEVLDPAAFAALFSAVVDAEAAAR
jgi:16S rRNA (adenine1518-N6/adenine1519-N6)-dimethyltransferase